MNKNSKIFSFFLILVFICGSFLGVGSVLAQNADHIVISEILVTGDPTTYDFIELYNPTSEAINLDGYRLVKRTDSAVEDTLIKSWTSDAYIPANGFYLWANSSYNINPVADITTAKSIANKNGIALRYGSNNIGDIVDSVTWGEINSGHIFKEDIAAINPEQGWSLERKAFENSQAIDMIVVGKDEKMGNGWDTDNNSFDFVVREIPNPQNSASEAEQSGSTQDNTANGDTPAVDGANEEEDISTVDDIVNNEDSESLGDSESVDDAQNDVKQAGSTQENGAISNEEQTDTTSESGSNSNGVNNTEDVYILPKIIITEFLPNPEDSDKDYEFIELYNNEKKDVDLKGWTIEDQAGKVKIFVIPEKNIIKSKSYKVFYSDETGIALNNSGDGVILRDDKENIVSKTPISDSAKEEQSYSLDENGNWVWSIRITPGRENIIKLEERIQEPETIKKEVEVNKKKEEDKIIESAEKEIYDFSDQVIISEIFPNPVGRDNTNGLYEWVELYNDSEKDVNLNGWQIDDILDKGSKPYIIENVIIKPHEYLLFSSETTKIIFNNSGDEANLLWADGGVVDSIVYNKSSEGYSYSLSSEDTWSWNKNISPGKENQIQSVIVEKEIKEAEIEYNDVEDIEDSEGQTYLLENQYIDAEIKDLDKFVRYTKVKISGTVSTPPGIFSPDVLYLSAVGAGVQVYSKEGRYPEIQIGDFVEAVGLVSGVGGETRILLLNSEDINIISRDNYVEPKVTPTGEVNKNVEGQLVLIEGKISETKEDVFFVDDGSGAVKIYLKPQTKIQTEGMQKGDWIVIAGQVSRTSLGYRILPRFQNDIKTSLVSGVSNVAETSYNSNENNLIPEGNNKSPLLAVLAMVGTFILIDWGRMRIRKR